MKRFISFFSLLLIAAVQSWASLPTPKVEYVQLYANGPMWATMNLGATSVTDAGKYFWWGDVQGHAKGEGFNFNYDNPVIASLDNDKEYVASGELVAKKDAATQQLGAEDRMPTQAEFEDLFNQCDWAWKSDYNGATGYLVIGKGEYADNSIFLPAAGSFLGNESFSDGSYGYYWSSTPDPDDADCAYRLRFHSNEVDPYNNSNRSYGYSIRPVRNNPAQAAAYNYIVSLMGEKVYSATIYTLHVNDEGNIVFSAMGNSIALTHNVTVDGNEYMFENPNFADMKVVIEDGEIAHIYLMEKGTIIMEFDENGDSADLESELAALMGDNVYAFEDFKSFVNEGMVIFSEDGDNIPLKFLGKLTKTEGNYFYQLPKDVNLIFLVREDEVTEIYMVEGYNEVIAVLTKQDLIAQITIGEETTKYTDVEEFVSAFEEVNSTATVKLLSDITLPEDDFLVNRNSDADITLDLNGHNITGDRRYNAVIFAVCKLTISGEGVVENKGGDGDVVGSDSYLEINGGTYIGTTDICFTCATMIINGGKFKADVLYYQDSKYNITPIVYGGLFSMDPSDCVAEGYEVVENDDEETMEEYPYKVVESASTPTAIESINAEKAQKAIKTIENGKVVIIRNGVKYDLAGRRL